MKDQLEMDSQKQDSQKQDRRLSQIERKLKLLILLGFTQMAILALLLLGSFLPNLFIYIQFLLIVGVLIGLAYFFRNQIPGWVGDASRLLFSFFENDRDQGTGKH